LEGVVRILGIDRYVSTYHTIEDLAVAYLDLKRVQAEPPTTD
jgi:hypothetical protein